MSSVRINLFRCFLKKKRFWHKNLRSMEKLKLSQAVIVTTLFSGRPADLQTCSASFVVCQSNSCCKSVCYTYCFLFSRPWSLVYQTQQVSKNVTISYFHHWPPLHLLSVICMAAAHSVLLFPLIFSPHCQRDAHRCECNFWYTLEVAGEFCPAAPVLCST